MGALSGLAKIPDGGNKLYFFTKSDKDAVIFSLNDLDKITFSDDGILMWLSNETIEYSFAEFNLISFSEDITPTNVMPINMYAPSKTNISYNHADEIIAVVGSSSLQNVSIYDTQGQIMISEKPLSNNFHFSIANLTKGVYIVKVTEKNRNTVKKFVK